MKHLTTAVLSVQTRLSPTMVRGMLFGVALLLALVAPGGSSVDGFNIGGCGGG